KRSIDRALEDGSEQVARLVTSSLTQDELRHYGEIDLGNPKVRWLADDVLDSGAWQVAWLPPSLPYYSARGSYESDAVRGFTKRLLFSAWNVAPKGIATMLSYEVERRLNESSASTAKRDYFGERRTGLLSFTRGVDD